MLAREVPCWGRRVMLRGVGAAAVVNGTRGRATTSGATQDPGHTILLVEDDPAVARMLVDRLEAKGYRVWHADSAAVAARMVDEAPPDAVILDLMLPDMHGLVLCADLKAKAALPIIICSATKRRDDLALGFKLGADDFIAKPFSTDELLVRLEAALGRGAPRPATERPGASTGWRIGELAIDDARCRVTLGGEVIHLTPTEYQLLCALASRPDRVVSRKELAEQVWGHYDPDIGRSLDVHMRRLRAKLNAGVAPPPRVVTLRGFGYELVGAAQPDGAAATGA
jgi:DNA-binding response OmpR family regulator